MAVSVRGLVLYGVGPFALERAQIRRRGQLRHRCRIAGSGADMLFKRGAPLCAGTTG